jgi:hypothetical protein
MANWNQHDLRPHMKVYSSNWEHVGHIAEIYEDSFLIHKGYFFPTDRYTPYSAIASLEKDGVQLALNANQVQEAEWEIRPDYENHFGDPTQLFYDRGHGIHDPFDENGFTQSNP